MSKPKLGSLFSGVGGLDIAVCNTFGAEVAWHSEINKAANKVLEKHFPDVPNHGDIKKIDWTQVEPVDILAGGFPCQDVSIAGGRAGLKEGTRSGLWSEFAKAIEVLKPKVVVIENVRGLLTAKADSGVEYPAEILAGRGNKPVLTAIQAVLGDLSELGYDAKWKIVSASEAGAAHRRARIFIIAYPSNASSSTR